MSGQALAARRVALVIGNSDYQHVAKLPNPAGDASAIAALLKQSGFDLVEQHTDLGIRAFRHVLREFAETSRGADMAVVYYAGHGMEVAGANYLIPIDAKLRTDLDIEDEAMPLDRVLRSLEAARTRLVILDACRDNPFVSQMSRLTATRSVGRGLARIEPNTSDMLIAFAAKAGSIAADGISGHSPFTTALVKYVAEPGLDIRLALGKVRDEVLSLTHGRQEPFVYGSLGGATVALAPETAAAESKPDSAAPVDPVTATRNDYELAERVGTKGAWELFVARYPNGFYSDLARAQLAKLGNSAKPAATEPLLSPSAVVAVAKPATKSDIPATAAELLPAVKEQPGSTGPQSQPDLVVISPNPAPPSTQETKPAATAPNPVASGPGPSERKSAMLTVPSVEADTPDSSHKSVVAEAIRSLQLELKRVGCDPGADLGLWEEGSKRALEKFNKYAGTKLMVNVASIEALEAVRKHKDRVCPLACRAGYHTDGDRCIRSRRRHS